MVPAMHHLVGVHLRVYEKCTLAQILRMKIAPPSNGDLFHPARKGQQSIPVIFVFYPLLFFSFIFIQISSKLKILKEEGRRKLICIIYKNILLSKIAFSWVTCHSQPQEAHLPAG